MVQELAEAADHHLQMAEAGWKPGSIDDFVRMQLTLTAGYFESHPCFVALWFGRDASPPVFASFQERNRAFAVRVREQLVGHGLIKETAPVAVFGMYAKLGDRVLEIALRRGRTADREALELGAVALSALLHLWAVEP